MVNSVTTSDTTSRSIAALALTALAALLVLLVATQASARPTTDRDAFLDEHPDDKEHAQALRAPRGSNA